MPGRVAGKVAFITGAARSQGRSHAIRLAQEGADIIAVDVAGPIESVTAYPGATEEDLAETVKQVEALDRRIVAVKADVRDSAALKAAVDDGVAQLGKLDIVCSNSGVVSFGHVKDVTPEEFDRVFTINTRGQFFVAREAYKHLEVGGRLILMGSITGQAKGVPKHTTYSGSKGAIETFTRCMAIG